MKTKKKENKDHRERIGLKWKNASSSNNQQLPNRAKLKVC